jgi:hypothetical protein
MTIVRKLQLLLALSEDGSISALKQVLQEQRTFADQHARASYRLVIRDAASRKVMPSMGVPEFDEVLELGVPDDTGDEPLIAAAGALGPQLTGIIDPTRSAVLLGQEYLFRNRQGPFQLFRIHRRKKVLTTEQYSDHMRKVHSIYGMLVPGAPGYRQLHRHHASTLAAAEAAGVAINDIDGIAQLIFPEADSIRTMMEGDEAIRDATLADGRLFVDPTGIMGMIASVIEYHDPA